jgi:glycosyltransferase involved in cell wall biosynthesis
MTSNLPLSLVLADCADSLAVERALWELATRLPRQRYDLRVWLSSNPAKQPLASALEAADIPVDRLPGPAAWSWKQAYDVWSRLRRVRPTMIHLHFDWPSREGVSSGIAGMAGVRHRVVSAHGGRTPDSNVGATRGSLERADLVTATSDLFIEQLARESGLPRERFRRVPTGIDPVDEEAEYEESCLWRERLGAGLLRPLWVCAGRWEPHRGAQVFVEALGIARQRELPFVAALAGGGSLRDAIERRLAELDLDASVALIDDLEDPGPLLMAADAVVVPSLWDSLSTVLLEAMARERPVVASAVGGAPDVVENGVTGVLVPPGDASALADALESFHRHPDAARRLGHEAAHRVGGDLTWQRVVEAYETVYDEVLGLATFVPEREAVARGRW